MKVIASHNGLAAAQIAWDALQAGKTPLDACVAGVTAIEDDPAESSVGFGGSPTDAGVVELDAAVMDGATHRGAGVAALQNVRHPAQVARLLMQQTNRVLLVGEGALRFAKTNGFSEENLLTEEAREIWLHWKRTRSAVDDWRPPAAETVPAHVREWFAKFFHGSSGYGKVGTVHCAALAQNGDLACCTSTSGHAFKLPGRVGDSPILGAGLYVDNAIGSCGSIGHGEANLENLSSFAAVEQMRNGKTLREAGLEILKRIVERTRPEQRDPQGRPKFNLWLFLLAKSGECLGVTMWGPKTYAVADEQGVRLEACVPLFERER